MENAARIFLKDKQLPVHRCGKCVEIKREYIEKQQSCFT
jgi:bacterioferritin-associated ferredoxin